MPDVDGAHGYLTALLPLNIAPCSRIDGTPTSPAHEVRELLARLPTAQHSPACLANAAQSPFARGIMTHFARFAVIDAPAFNGHARRDAIRVALPGGVDPLSEPHVDQLPCPYILFCADFDVAEALAYEPERAIRAYLESLWAEAPELWSALLDHCDSAKRVTSGANFAEYVQRRSVETTMPFNDYGIAPTPVANRPGPIIAPATIGVVAGVVIGAVIHILLPGAGWVLASLVGIIALVVAAGLAIVHMGRISTPWSTGTSLPVMLKALYLQAAFARFAALHQGVASEILLNDFQDFLATARPSDLSGPTQAPGVVPQ
jgi:hypothetical protein